MEYENMTEEDLRDALKEQEARAAEAYQLFTRCAASHGAAHVKAFCEAGAEAGRIREELKRRKRRGNDFCGHR